jgi:hypothetical protein
MWIWKLTEVAFLHILGQLMLYVLKCQLRMRLGMQQRLQKRDTFAYVRMLFLASSHQLKTVAKQQIRMIPPSACIGCSHLQGALMPGRPPLGFQPVSVREPRKSAQKTHQPFLCLLHVPAVGSHLSTW